MNKLLAFINSLTSVERDNFARAAGTSIGYLRKAISSGARLGDALCVAIERASFNTLTCEDLRPDIDWVRVHDLDWPHPEGRPLVDHSRQHREAA